MVTFILIHYEIRGKNDGRRNVVDSEWIIWQGDSIARLFRYWILTALLGILPSWSQDIVSSKMPNLDLNSEDGRKLMEGRDTVSRFLFLHELGKLILMLEKENPMAMSEQERIKLYLDAIPLKALSQCPEDFRQTIQQWKDACEKKLKESGEIPEEVARSVYGSMKWLLEKYRIQETMGPMMRWLEKETGFSPLNGDGFPVKEEMLQRLKAFKEKLESGEVVIPVEAEGNEKE